MKTIRQAKRKAKQITHTTLLSAFMSLASAQVLASKLPEQPPPWAARPDAQAPSTPLPVKAVPAMHGSSTPKTEAGQVSIAEWYQQRNNKLDDSAKILEHLHERASVDDLNAQYEIGLFYQKRPDLNPGLSEAEYWLGKAAEANHAKAQYVLAMLLRSGEVKVDHDLSLQWQQQSADNGYDEAQYGLGLLYANGQYVQADSAQAHYWFQQAAAQGHEMARLALANQAAAPAPSHPAPISQAQPQIQAAAAENASFTTSSEALDEASAETWLDTVAVQPAVEYNTSAVDLGKMTVEEVAATAQQGDMYAQLMLGALYEDGSKDVQQDLSQAAYWYGQSAQQGYAKAQHNLALLYEDGRGLEQDYAKAAYWYQQAANAGFSEAQNNLAVLYLLGNGVQKNRAFAEQLLRAALAQNNENAKRNLSMLEQQASQS